MRRRRRRRRRAWLSARFRNAHSTASRLFPNANNALVGKRRKYEEEEEEEEEEKGVALSPVPHRPLHRLTLVPERQQLPGGEKEEV